MNNKVTIIGAGSVGATIAYTLVVDSPVSEIVLIDVNHDKARGEALDIKQATPFLSPTKVYEGTYEDAEGSDIVVVTSGIGRKPGQSRIDLTQTNVDIIKSIAPEIVKHAPDAIYVIVANPVDILTYVFAKVTGLPKSRVFGSGTILDTIRLRTRLSELYSINQKQVHAYVLGEHGDTSFVAWSTADITGIPLNDYDDALTNKSVLPITPYQREEVEEYVRKSGGKIIAGKGATFYGIAASLCHIIKCIYSGADTVMTLSTLLEGEYGISDVCLSTLCVLGSRGILSTLAPKMSEEEMAKFRHSAEALKSVIAQVNI
ncbi:MAG TPA: L-lactate dehydrogenase [Candidatus Scatosoma pullicola]|nr:L-lactate dehydrogenase [Candidatus Scatosoma pullicola]